MKYKDIFDENFRFYGKEVVIQIITLFEEELDGRLATIGKNIADLDFDNLKFNAHSLKGAIAAYGIKEPAELARKLEEKGRNRESDDLTGLFSSLKMAASELMEELKEYRQYLSES